MRKTILFALPCAALLLAACSNTANTETDAGGLKADTLKVVKEIKDTAEAKNLLQGNWKIIPPPGATNEAFGSFMFDGNNGEMYIRMGKGKNQRTSDSSTYAEKTVFTYTTAPVNNGVIVLYAANEKHSITEATGFFKQLANDGTISKKWKDKDTMRFKFLSVDTIQALPDPTKTNNKPAPLIRFYRVK